MTMKTRAAMGRMDDLNAAKVMKSLNNKEETQISSGAP